MNSKEDMLPVSVVVPTYNGHRFIGETLCSVFEQTCLPSEVIVVDDASTDGTVGEVEKALASAPIPVKLIRLPHNSGGPAKPMNVGIGAAQSPLIAVLDQDDLWLPERIESHATVLSAHTDVAFVFGYVDVKQEHGGPMRVDLPEKQWGRLRKQMDGDADLLSCDGRVALRVLLNHGNCIGGFPGFTFRRDDWQTMGGIDQRLVAAADYDLLCLLCQRGRVAMVPRVQYLHRVHENNLSGTRLLCLVDQLETLGKHADCVAWPEAPDEVRQAIGSVLYSLAVSLGVAGSASIAMRMLTTSLLVGGPRPRSLVRAADYAFRVRRRRRRSAGIGTTAGELNRVVAAHETAIRLYGRRWWGLQIGNVATSHSGGQSLGVPRPLEGQERRAA